MRHLRPWFPAPLVGVAALVAGLLVGMLAEPVLRAMLGAYAGGR